VPLYGDTLESSEIAEDHFGWMSAGDHVESELATEIDKETLINKSRLTSDEKKILEMYTSGYKLTEIGTVMGVSSARIHQKIYGVRGFVGIADKLSLAAELLEMHSI